MALTGNVISDSIQLANSLVWYTILLLVYC